MKKLLRKENKGITLVVLVITIILLLILAGIIINSLTENGLFENTKLAKGKIDKAQQLENKTLQEYEGRVEEYINGTRNNLECTTLYPNGSEEQPPTIKTSQRIEVPNPYPGKNIYVRVEVLYDEEWGETGFIYLPGGRRIWSNCISTLWKKYR